MALWESWSSLPNCAGWCSTFVAFVTFHLTQVETLQRRAAPYWNWSFERFRIGSLCPKPGTKTRCEFRSKNSTLMWNDATWNDWRLNFMFLLFLFNARSTSLSLLSHIVATCWSLSNHCRDLDSCTVPVQNRAEGERGSHVSKCKNVRSREIAPGTLHNEQDCCNWKHPAKSTSGDLCYVEGSWTKQMWWKRMTTEGISKKWDLWDFWDLSSCCQEPTFETHFWLLWPA